MSSHGNSHSHSHSHGSSAGGDNGQTWIAWSGDRVLQILLLLIAVAAVVTVAAMIVLWPTGKGQDEARAQADEIGLATQRLSATVQEVVDRPCSYSSDDNPQECREITFLLHEGPEAGAIIILPEFNLSWEQAAVGLVVEDEVVLGFEDSTNTYFYADRDRRAPLVLLGVLFAVVVVVFGRFRGVFALLAMGSTIVVLVLFVAPSVLDGNDPLVVSIVAASAIAFISLYLTHGFSPTTTVALAGTLGALGLTLGLTWVFFALANFSGLASEAGYALPFISKDIDLSSLLLGGAVLGTLGALDDVTVTQAATVAELHYRSPDLTAKELVVSGVRVGREHIASTVNTLLLAYTGASMPLLLLVAVSGQSLGMAANSELVAVEIVRTLCGSIGLVAAMPITTALAAVVSTRGVPALPACSTAAATEAATANRAASPNRVVDPSSAADSKREPQVDPSPQPMGRGGKRDGSVPEWEDFSPKPDDMDW